MLCWQGFGVAPTQRKLKVGKPFRHSASRAARTMVEASALRSRAPACGLAGDLLLSGPSISKSLVRDAATRLSPPASPQKDAHHLPRDLLHGWHSTVGRAPSGRGRTPMRQFFSKLGAVFIILATPPSATFTCAYHSNAAQWAGLHADDALSPVRRVWTIYSGDEAGTMTGTLGKIWNRPGALLDMFAPVTTRAMGFVAAYALFEAVIMMVVPGKTFLGPVTAGGKQPVYKVSVPGPPVLHVRQVREEGFRKVSQRRGAMRAVRAAESP